MGYWKAKDQCPADPTVENKKASDQKSEASSVIPFRHLVKIQDFRDLPPLPLAVGANEVGGGYILENGRAGGIRLPVASPLFGAYSLGSEAARKRAPRVFRLSHPVARYKILRIFSFRSDHSALGGSGRDCAVPLFSSC